MTNPIYGSSLFQARKTEHVHRHSHLHDRKSYNAHARSHAEFHKRLEDIADLEPRDTITEVVQTVSVVQIVDGSGATVSVQTVTGSSQTDLVDGETGSTIDVAFKDASTPSSYPSATMTDAGTTTAIASSSESATETAISSADPISASADTTISSTTDSVVSTSATDSATTTTSLPSGLSLTLTSDSASSTFTSLLSASNSTSSTLTPISSTVSSLLATSLTSTNTSDILGSTTLSPGASSTTFLSSTVTSASEYTSSGSVYTWSSSSDASSSAFSSFSDSASATSGVGGGDGSGAGTATATASGGTSSNTSGASGSSANDTSTQTREVVGGVFGGIAGVALLVGLAFLILRMKKRGWCHLRLGSGEDEDTPPAASRALPATSGDGGSGNGAYGTMQRTARPQSAVAASLAALAGKRTSRERSGSGPEMAERGFVRVSGRKLPPVLQYGGDGYTDPRRDRDSQVSNASVYRDSMAIFDQPNHTRLALGSPMRPESGIMTMQPGPAKVAVTTEAPKHIDSPTLPRSSTFPSTDAVGRTLAAENLSRDAVGRTLAAHDYSRDGSASRASHASRGSARFTEHVS